MTTSKSLFCYRFPLLRLFCYFDKGFDCP